MPPPKLPEKKFLQTKRYDMMFIKDESWDFFDAFNNSEQSQAAFSAGEISSKGKNIEKYLAVTRNRTIDRQRELMAANTVILPETIQNLQTFQEYDGKFENYGGVLRCLHLPNHIRFQKDETYSPWEKATAFAIAYIRQHNELFEHLADMHDKASQWITSNEIIYEARELLIANQFTSKEDEEQSTGGNSESLRNTGIAQLTPYELASMDMMALSAENNEEQQRISSADNRSKFAELQRTLSNLTIKPDEAAINAQKAKLDNIQLQVIQHCITVEKLVLEIINCKERCVAAYTNSEMCTERYKTFDELTCRLGEGQHPIEGFYDWRQHGVPGLRPAIVDFFCEVQHMAEARLDLEEMEAPGGRALYAKNDPAVNVSRWTLVWGGSDVVLKIVHCLDFLRKCRELYEWYGPAFWVIANPLALPFPLHPAFDKLEMHQMVDDQLMSVAHLRLGNAVVENKDGWQHQQFLNKWRRTLLSCMEERAFNWPAAPHVKEDVHNERLYTAILVMFIKCKESLKKSYLWEKKFLQDISTTRGQDTLLVGASTAKVNKKLNIPTADQRISRPNGMLTQNKKKDFSGLLRKASNAVRASNIFQNNIMHLNESSVSLGDGDSAEGSSIVELDNKVETRPNLSKAKMFTDLLKTAQTAQQSKLAAGRVPIAQEPTTAPNVITPVADYSTGNRFRSKVPTMFMQNRSGSPGLLATRRSRMNSVMSSSGGGGLRKASSVSNMHPTLSSPERHGSVMRKSSTASHGLGGNRKQSVQSSVSPGKRSNSRQFSQSHMVAHLGLLREDSTAGGLTAGGDNKPRSASSFKKHSVSSPSHSSPHNKRHSTSASGLLPSSNTANMNSLEEGSDEAVPNKSATKKRKGKKKKGAEFGKPIKLNLGNSNVPDSDNESEEEEEEDQFESPAIDLAAVGKVNSLAGMVGMLRATTQQQTRSSVVSQADTVVSTAAVASGKGEKKKKKRNKSVSEDSGTDDSDNNPSDTNLSSPNKKDKRKPSTAFSVAPAADMTADAASSTNKGSNLLPRASSAGRTTRIGSKHKLAIEIAKSTVVTRLPAVVDGSTKLTRRKESSATASK